MAIFGKKHDESEEIQLFESTEMKDIFSLLIKNSSKNSRMIISFVSLDKIQSAIALLRGWMGKIYTTIKDYSLPIKRTR